MGKRKYQPAMMTLWRLHHSLIKTPCPAFPFFLTRVRTSAHRPQMYKWYTLVRLSHLVSTIASALRNQSAPASLGLIRGLGTLSQVHLIEEDHFSTTCNKSARFTSRLQYFMSTAQCIFVHDARTGCAEPHGPVQSVSKTPLTDVSIFKLNEGGGQSQFYPSKSTHQHSDTAAGIA